MSRLLVSLEILTLLQYNSLMKSARNPKSNFYPRIWDGPPTTELDSLGQLAAINLLSASMAVVEEVSPSPSPTNNPCPCATLTPPSAAERGSFVKLPVLVTLTVVSWGLGVVNAYFLWLRYCQERERTQRVRARGSLH